MSRVHEHSERAIDTEVKVRHEVTNVCARKAKVIDFIFQRNSSFRGVGVFLAMSIFFPLFEFQNFLDFMDTCYMNLDRTH